VTLALAQVLAHQGADEVARYLSQVAVTRLGPRGAPTEVGNLSIQTARVTHLTSREGDGQFHIHLMAMSKRAAQVATNRDRAEAAWRGQVPRQTALPEDITGWDQAAWAQDRRAKPDHPESPEEVAERVRTELATAGWDFTPGTRQPITWQAPSVAQVDREALSAEVVAVLSARKSAWSQAELSAQVHGRQPPNTSPVCLAGQSGCVCKSQVNSTVQFVCRAVGSGQMYTISQTLSPPLKSCFRCGQGLIP